MYMKIVQFPLFHPAVLLRRPVFESLLPVRFLTVWVLDEQDKFSVVIPWEKIVLSHGGTAEYCAETIPLTSTVFGRWCCQFMSVFILSCMWKHILKCTISCIIYGLKACNTSRTIPQELNFCKQLAAVV